MIYESVHWKDPLLETATRLEKLGTSKRMTGRRLVQVEKDVMLGCCSIRKLCEAEGAVSDPVRSQRFSLAAHRNVEPVNYLNKHRFDELYVFEGAAQPVELDLISVCNQVVHSYVFAPYVQDAGGLGSIFVSSDRHKDKYLYNVTLAQLLAIFRSVGADYPSSIQWTHGEDGKKDRLAVR